MVDLVIVIPTHNRPDTATKLTDIFSATCTANTALALAVDESDPTGIRYASALDIPLVDVRHATADDWAGLAERRIGVFQSPSTTMVQALNAVGTAIVGSRVQPFAVGFMGDDNRPRTVGWDARFLAELHVLGSGIVYGNDLFQGQNLPTQMAMTSDIVRTLGWLGPPALAHLYVDNFWRDFGIRAECLRYLPDVIIEHLHPLVGKSEVDDGYRRVNSPDSYQSGAAAYQAYVAERLDADVAKVQQLRRVRT